MEKFFANDLQLFKTCIYKYINLEFLQWKILYCSHFWRSKQNPQNVFGDLISSFQILKLNIYDYFLSNRVANYPR